MNTLGPARSRRTLSVLAHGPDLAHDSSYKSQYSLPCHYSDDTLQYDRTRYSESLIGSHPPVISASASRYPLRHRLLLWIDRHRHPSLHRRMMRKYPRDLPHQILIQIHQILHFIVHDSPWYHVDRSELFSQHPRVWNMPH